MSDDDKQGLYQLVRGWLVSDSHGRKRVEQAIFDAHNGRPDGYLVTNDNQWMFRQYRNSVSPDPKQLVFESLAYAEDA